MGVIQISKADILRSKVMESQWASFEIAPEIKTETNSKRDGLNYIVTFRLIDQTNADLNGKEFKRWFSSKAAGMFIPLVAAVRGVPIESFNDDFTFDIDELAGKKIDGKITIEVYQGSPNNKVEDYLPYKKGVNMQPAF